MRTTRALALLVGGLATADIARSTVVPDEWHLVYNLALAGCAVGVAALAGLGAEELGCGAARLGHGLRLGGTVLVAVGVVVTLVAFTGLVDDDRTDVGAGQMLVRALVVIPLGTVVVEEVIFRGVLDALLLRVMRPGRAMGVGAVLFGLWHVPPIFGTSTALQVLGTLAATTMAGVGLVWLRRRSGSLLAPMLAHLGTNSVALAAFWAASR